MTLQAFKNFKSGDLEDKKDAIQSIINDIQDGRYNCPAGSSLAPITSQDVDGAILVLSEQNGAPFTGLLDYLCSSAENADIAALYHSLYPAASAPVAPAK